MKLFFSRVIIFSSIKLSTEALTEEIQSVILNRKKFKDQDVLYISAFFGKFCLPMFQNENRNSKIPKCIFNVCMFFFNSKKYLLTLEWKICKKYFWRHWTLKIDKFYRWMRFGCFGKSSFHGTQNCIIYLFLKTNIVHWDLVAVSGASTFGASWYWVLKLHTTFCIFGLSNFPWSVFTPN